MSKKRRSNPRRELSVGRKPGSASRRRQIFYVAAEGEATEPEYLAHLNREFGDEKTFVIHPLSRRNGLSPREVVAKAVAEGEADGELWALFDRDQHGDIPEAFKAANADDVKVAFSNPPFDLWLLLHFSDFGGSQRGSNKTVHTKLQQHPLFKTFAKSGKGLGPVDNRVVTGNSAAKIRHRWLTAAALAGPAAESSASRWTCSRSSSARPSAGGSTRWQRGRREHRPVAGDDRPRR